MTEQLGHLYLGMSDNHTLDMGVQNLSDEITSSILQVPIVTYQAKDAFTYDSSSQDSFSITITRKNPDNAYDPLDDRNFISGLTVPQGEDAEDYVDHMRLFKDDQDWSTSFTWCNRLWKKALAALIDRWQFKTDGNRLTFIPIVTQDGTPNTEGVFQHALRQANVYLKSVSFTYTENTPEIITAQISMVMGTAHGKRLAGGI